MHSVIDRRFHRLSSDQAPLNWTCRLCTHSNPDDEDICCQQCGGVKR